MSGEDFAVSATNNDATLSKRSAIAKGYWEDKYINIFSKSRRCPRKPPIIHRGYFARTKAISMCAEWFCDHFAPKGKGQIVSIGCGFDTLLWRLRDSGRTVSQFHELDADSVVQQKQKLLGSADEQLFNGIDDGVYKLSAVDLRDTDAVIHALVSNGIDLKAPTLFIAECVLVYLNSSDTSAMLAALAKSFTTAVFVNYEMINPHDPFGQVMVKNLEARGCPLRGLKDCADLESQKKRFESACWSPLSTSDMNSVYSSLPKEELQRIGKLEMFDEVEEWQLISAHYCLVSAVVDKDQTFDTSSFPFLAPKQL